MSGDLRPPGPLWAIQLELQKSRKGLVSSLAVEPEVVVGLEGSLGASGFCEGHRAEVVLVPV